MQRFFIIFPLSTWHYTVSCCVQSHLYRLISRNPAFASLLYAQMVGGAKHAMLYVEAGIDLLRRLCLAVLLHHEWYIPKLSFWKTGLIDFLFIFSRLTKKFWVLKLIGCFYNTMTSYCMSKDQGNFGFSVHDPFNYFDAKAPLGV